MHREALKKLACKNISLALLAKNPLLHFGNTLS